MELYVAYDIEKDIENIINGTKSVNNKQPTKFQSLFAQKHGNHFEAAKLRIFIREQDEVLGLDIKKGIISVESKWKNIESSFTERVEKIFGTSYPSSKITVYLTHNERCTYNISKNYFFVKIGTEFSNNVIMHELLHFYTWHVFGKSLLDKGVSKLLYNDIKESLTQLLNMEFLDLLNGKIDDGYPQHKEMRSEVARLWVKYKDIEKVVSEILIRMMEKGDYKFE